MRVYLYMSVDVVRYTPAFDAKLDQMVEEEFGAVNDGAGIGLGVRTREYSLPSALTQEQIDAFATKVVNVLGPVHISQDAWDEETEEEIEDLFLIGKATIDPR